MKMDPAIKALWVNALRSGEYQQGYGYLKTVYQGETRFCCLGVLCDLAIKAGVDVEVEEDSADTYSYTYDGENARLPRSVTEWAGVDNNPTVNTKNQSYALTRVNDNLNYSFAKIANLIERDL